MTKFRRRVRRSARCVRLIDEPHPCISSSGASGPQEPGTCYLCMQRTPPPLEKTRQQPKPPSHWHAHSYPTHSWHHYPRVRHKTTQVLRLEHRPQKYYDICQHRTVCIPFARSGPGTHSGCTQCTPVAPPRMPQSGCSGIYRHHIRYILSDHRRAEIALRDTQHMLSLLLPRPIQ